MNRVSHSPAPEASEREALRRRVKQMYDWFNQGRWDRCFALIDPKLRDASKVELSAYAEGLEAFKAAYGSVSLWHVRINLHLDGASNKHDPRPFAYVYAVWKDEAHGFHMFRERWVKHGDRWFSRVVGLVPNASASLQGQERTA